MHQTSGSYLSESRIMEEQGFVMAAQSDPRKFSVIYELYYEPVLRFVYQRLDDKSLAFDVTSQVFLKAMVNIKKFTFRGVPFSAWLFRIARNELTDLFRKNSISRTINIETVQVHEIMDEMEEPNLEETIEKILETIGDLPEDELQLIEMRYFEKRSFKEIGDIIGITENNAKVKVYRIIHKIKECIKK